MASDGDRDDITRAHIVFVNPSVAAISARRSRCLGRSTIDCAGRGVGYRLGELDEVVLADATTIYKSPGSEYTPFVIPVLTQHYTSLQRSLLLHRHDARQTARRVGRPAQGRRHRCAWHSGPAAVVEIERAAGDGRRQIRHTGTRGSK